VRVSEWLAFATVALLVLSLVWAVIYPFVKGGLSGPLKALRPARMIPYAACLLLASVVLWGSVGRSRGGVKILQEKQVGIYDAKVVGAQGARQLVDWLNRQGFRFESEDEAAFESYTKKGWCFVTARVSAPDRRERGSHPEDTMAEPLILLFETKEIVYPLALTGTVGKETELLLYVFADMRVSAGNRLKTAYAGPRPTSHYFDHLQPDPPDFCHDLDMLFNKSPFLTKFRGRLKPEDMRTDLTFEQIGHEPHRETVVAFW